MRKLNLLLMLSSFLILSCQSDLENESFINVEDEYELSISQELSSEGGLAAINITTAHELDCSNYSIPYLLEIGQEKINLIINKVSLEENCIGPSSTISEKLNLSFNNGKRDITILLQDLISNSGDIIISDDLISMNLTSNYGIKINKAQINRIQKKMMWGSLSAGSQTSIDQINELLISIDNETVVKTGDYGLFYVANKSDLQFYDTEVADHTFVLYSDTNVEDIKDQINEVKESDPSLVFNLTLFDGQTINVK